MEKTEFKWMLNQVAKINGTTPEQVRAEMQIAMEEGQKNADPVIQAKWNAIPRKGSILTLEEFVEYLITEIESRSK